MSRNGSTPRNGPGSLSRKVMLIDDEPDILGFMEMALEEEGYQVTSVTSAIEALQSLREVQPELILLDAKMPAMNGQQFLAILRERDDVRVPVVLMTAARIQPHEVAELGAQGFLAKPFDLDDLLACVEKHLA